MHDVESYINNISRIDKNHDYNRDGNTHAKKQCGSLNKINHLAMNIEIPFEVKQIAPMLIGSIDFPDFLINVPEYLQPAIDYPPRLFA